MEEPNYLYSSHRVIDWGFGYRRSCKGVALHQGHQPDEDDAGAPLAGYGHMDKITSYAQEGIEGVDSESKVELI